MDAVSVIGLIAGILALVASCCAIATFVGHKKKEGYEEGNNDGGLRGDVKYMRNSFDDLRLDIKEINRKSDSQAERITRVEESCKQAHKRIDSLEQHSK